MQKSKQLYGGIYLASVFRSHVLGLESRTFSILFWKHAIQYCKPYYWRNQQIVLHLKQLLELLVLWFLLSKCKGFTEV